jgi:hypothetical protein
MNNYQLENYLKEYHVRVVCSDDIPVFSKRSKTKIWNVNTDRCGGRGLHWVTFFFLPENRTSGILGFFRKSSRTLLQEISKHPGGQWFQIQMYLF